ncbi:MAG: hypothetical protein CMQ40_10835 [Gammaproteobacteria bacterium]|nr:hypothetical protein [Gammaproteobacteria bacterium]
MALSRKMTGEELAQIREKLGATQVEFGVLLGRSPSSVSQMERGEAPVTESFALLVRLVEKFGIEEIR